MTDQDTTLKPCAHCGSAPKQQAWRTVNDGPRVNLYNCANWSCPIHAVYFTAEEWNARTTDAEIERLTKDLDEARASFDAAYKLAEEWRRRAATEGVSNERLRSALDKAATDLDIEATFYAPGSRLAACYPQSRQMYEKLRSLSSQLREALTSTSASPVLAVVEAARELARYDDFSEPLGDCPRCDPAQPEAMNAARQRLHDALAALDTGTGATQENGNG